MSEVVGANAARTSANNYLSTVQRVSFYKARRVHFGQHHHRLGSPMGGVFLEEIIGVIILHTIHQDISPSNPRGSQPGVRKECTRFTYRYTYAPIPYMSNGGGCRERDGRSVVLVWILAGNVVAATSSFDD
jgi:hypothetical protein